MKKLYTSLKSLHKCLQSNKIEYAVIGGLAVAVWGEPRLTQDIDVKVNGRLSTRASDARDFEGIIDCQGDKLDDNYIIDWLTQFEVALDDSTLINTYQKMRFL